MGSTPCRCSSVEPVQDVDPLPSDDSIDQQSEKITNRNSFVWPLPSTRSETSFEMTLSTDFPRFYDVNVKEEELLFFKFNEKSFVVLENEIENRFGNDKSFDSS